MKKIMFNDRYGLTEAVLKGRKTMTRRIIPQLLNVEDPDISDWGLKDGGKAMITLYEGGRPTTDIFPTYQPGETVAIAQRYSELSWDEGFYNMLKAQCERLPQYELAGWDNKMFVKAAYMPHRIEITNIKFERLQNISNEDCLKEGIFRDDIDQEFPFGFIDKEYPFVLCECGKHIARSLFPSPNKAFAALINNVSGKGTWERNPWVFAYSFKLLM